jgi:hypothetical protein
MIKGISDIRRLPRLGCIRLGVKIPVLKDGKPQMKNNQPVVRPKEVDYFILDPATPDDEERGEYLSQFSHLFGYEPKSIEIMLPVNNPEVFFPQFYKRYGSTTDLKCYGDNEIATCMEKEFAKGMEVVDVVNEKTRVKCYGNKCIHVDKQRPECGIVGSLLVLIPKISMAGVWQITTRSFNSIVNLNSSIALASEDGKRRIAMMPAMLHRRPQQTKHNGQKSTHYILHLGIDNFQAQAQIEPPVDTLILPDADASTEAVAIRGEDVNKETGEGSMTNEEAGTDTFIAGLKEDADKVFEEFILETKIELRKLTGDDHLYGYEMEEFKVAYLKDVSGDVQKQKLIRDKLEKTLVETRKLNNK